MKRTIFIIISCVLLLGLVLAVAGCTEDNHDIGSGKQVGVWPYGSDPTVESIDNTLCRLTAGINWTDVQYEGTQEMVIPDEWVTIWKGW